MNFNGIELTKLTLDGVELDSLTLDGVEYYTSVVAPPVGNPVYAQWSVARSHANSTITQDGMRVETTSGYERFVVDMEKSTGKWYFEMICDQDKDASQYPRWGLSNSNEWSALHEQGDTSDEIAYDGDDGDIAWEGGHTHTGLSLMRYNLTGSEPDCLGVAIDLDTMTIDWFVNGVHQVQSTWQVNIGTGLAISGTGDTSSKASWVILNTGATPFRYPENIPVGYAQGWGTDIPVK